MLTLASPMHRESGALMRAPHPHDSLSLYEIASRALAEARTVDEVKKIHDEAEALRAYARQAKNRALEIDAAEIRIRSARCVGELLIQQKATFGLAKGGQPYQAGATGSETKPVERAPTLAEVGIDKKLSSTAQKLAAVLPEKFESMMAEWRERVADENNRVVVSLLREAELAEKRESYVTRTASGGRVDDLTDLAQSGARFGAILVDPPWEFHAYSGRGKMRSAESHYDTMSLDDIMALPIQALAAEDCTLFIWGVWPELPGALRVIEAWGFSFKTCGFLWVKQQRGAAPAPDGQFSPDSIEEPDLHLGLGYWTRANTEPCLLATRGSPRRLANDVRQVTLAPVGAHSRKPDVVHSRIERLVGGPYLELFARRPVEGWTVWGNELASASYRGRKDTVGPTHNTDPVCDDDEFACADNQKPETAE